MIKVSVLFPNEQGKNFDFDYYFKTHMPLVDQRLEHESLVRTEEAKGISSAVPGSQAPFILTADLYFESVDAVHQAFTKHGHELMGDRSNFTDIEPKVQISEIIS